MDHLAVNARLCESWVKFATFSVQGVIGLDVNDFRETVFLRKALRQLQDRRSNIVQRHVGVLLSSLDLRWANSVTTNLAHFLTGRCLSRNTAAGCTIIESVNSVTWYPTFVRWFSELVRGLAAVPPIQVQICLSFEM